MMTAAPRTDSAPGARPVPLTVIAGYLGAGKTTVLAHLLRHCRAQRVAVLLNDSDGAHIDESLIPRRARRCIRCPTSSAVAEALADLRRRSEPLDHVLVEASSLSDAQLIGQYGFLPGYALDGIIDVADSEAIHSQATSPAIGPHVMGQLWTADLIVLNKTDLLSAREKEAVCDWLGEAIPNGRVVECSYGRLPPTLLLGRHPANDARLQPRREGHSRSVERYPQEVGYSSWTWSGAAPLEEGAFRWWAGTLPPGILRAKGILHFRRDPGSRFVFDLIGPRWSLRREESWGRQRPRSSVSLLGRSGSFDPQLLEMTIKLCSGPHLY